MDNRKQRKSKQRPNISAVSADIGLVGTRADDHLVLSDLTYRPVSGVYSAKPPKQILNQIFFARQSTAGAITTSTSAAVESNIAFSAANDMEQYGAYLSIFDQYYLHSAVVTLTNVNHITSGSNYGHPIVHTAIDFDTVSSLGSIAAIESYGSHNVDVLLPGKSVTRIIMPCNNTVPSNGSGNITRQWANTVNPNIAFYGFRSIVEPTGGSGTVLNVSIQCTWAFRNTI
jgi:hypothetical protein